MNTHKENTDVSMVIAELLARDSATVMLLFAAYIDDYLCYKFFSEGIPYENFLVLRAELNANLAFRAVLRKSGVIESGVQHYIRTALDDYNMFYHFLDGISTIIADSNMTCMIPIRDRNLIRGLFELWKKGNLTEDSWDVRLEMLRRSA